MALGDRADRKLVDEFLRQGPAGSGFVEQLDQRIVQGRESRRAAQQANRAIGGGPWEGRSPFRNTPQMNPSGMGGRQVMQQGMGRVPASNPRVALPSAGRGLPAQFTPSGSPAVPGGGLAVPNGGSSGVAGAPRALPTGAPRPPVSATYARGASGAVGAGARAGAQSADDLLGVAGRASIEGADDAAAAAARQAGRSVRAPAGSTSGIIRQGAGSPMSIGQKLGVNVTRAGLMKGAGVAGAGLMASQFFDGLDLGNENSLADRGGTGALLGAGLGAGGAMALGIPHVAAAAAGGAILLGGYKALWGEDRTTPQQMEETIADTRETIASLGEMYGIEGDAMSDILLQYEASTSMYVANEDKEGLKQFMAGMGTQLPALMLQARDQMKSEQQEQERYQSMMQAQAQFAPIFEQSLDRANQASQTAYQTANNSANYLDQRQPQLAALFRQTAAQSQASAANLQAAYARQMGQAPVVTGTVDELERQLAQQELMNQQLAGVGQFP